MQQLSGTEMKMVNGGVKVIYVRVTRSDGSYYFNPVVVSDDYPDPISYA